MNAVSLQLAEKLFAKVERIPEGIDVLPIADGVLAECGIAATYEQKMMFAAELAEAIGFVRVKKTSLLP